MRIPSVEPTVIEDRHILNSLEKIVNSLARAGWAGRDDLMQEGLIHLWQSEQERPGQSPSWYLQGCRFRLQHYLHAGRSLDSNKRRCNRVDLSSDDRHTTQTFDKIQVELDPHHFTSARDLLHAIAGSLKPKERAVLECLADGLSVTEIARRLGLSCPTVAKYRRRIAQIATRLGMASDIPQATAA